MTNKEKILLLLLSSINFTHIVDFMIMMPLGPQLMRIMQINPQQFSLLVAAYTFSAGIMSLIAAFFVDRFNRKHVVLVGYAGFVLGTFACAIAPDYDFLLLARIVAGMFGGVIAAHILAIIGDVFPYEKRGTAMGFLMGSFSIASVAGVPCGLWLAANYSWHAPFIFVGVMSVLIFAAALVYVPDLTKHISEVKESRLKVFKDIGSDTNQQWALLLMFVMMLGHFSIIPFIAPYMVSNVGLSEHQLSFIYLIGGGLTIFSSPLIGKLADKIGKFKVYAIFVTCSLVPVLLITNLNPLPLSMVLVVTSMFFIVSGGRSIPAMAMISSVVHPKQRGGFMNINASLQHLATGLASFVAGMIILKNSEGKLEHYNYVGFLAAIASLLSIFIASKLKPVDNNK